MMRLPTNALPPNLDRAYPERLIEIPRELDLPKIPEHGVRIPPEMPRLPAAPGPTIPMPEVVTPPRPKRDWYILATEVHTRGGPAEKAATRGGDERRGADRAAAPSPAVSAFKFGYGSTVSKLIGDHSPAKSSGLGDPAPTESSDPGPSFAKKAIGFGLLTGSSDSATKLFGMSLLAGLI